MPTLPPPSFHMILFPFIIAATATAAAAAQTRVPKEALKFGAVTSDHMLDIDWSHEYGWTSPRIIPYAPLQLDPTASCLHYGIEAFEGMKAFINETTGIPYLFRPELNMNRLNNSMVRLALPPLDKQGFLNCIKELVKLDK